MCTLRYSDGPFIAVYSLNLKKNGSFIMCPTCKTYVVGKKKLSDRFFVCLGKNCAEPYELEVTTDRNE